MSSRHIIQIAFLTLIVAGKTSAQNINGDTIFVSTENQTWLTFYSAPNGQVTKDANSFTVSGTGKSISIVPLKSNTRTTTLMVQEGSRTHQFLVFYKDDLNPLESSYDYTDLKKIERRIKEKEAQKGSEKVASTKPASSSESKKSVSETRPAGSGVSQGAIDVALAISAGDDAFDKGKYTEAKEAYQKALSLKSNNEYSKTRIAAIDKLVAEKERLAKKLQDDNYNNALLKAAKAFTAKKYDDAKASYRDALDSRPNDAFATNQIAAIDKISADEAQRAKQDEARRQQEETYQTTIVNADKALVAQDFETAKSYYSLASSYKPADPYPKRKLEETERKISALSKEKESKEKEASYQMTLTKAKSAFEAQNYEMSKEIYNEALIIKPGDNYVKDQLKSIDKAISTQAKREDELKRNAAAESDFNEAIVLADNAFKAENYETAKSEYSKALRLKKDSRAENQLKAINTILDKEKERALGEKEKQQKELARNNNYNLAIKNADTYYNNKDYVNARISYKLALNYKDEQGPKDKVAEIETILSDLEATNKASKEKEAAENEVTKKYTAALAKGRSYESNNDFENAKLAYLEALQLKPSETSPKTRIEAIDKKAADKDITNRYDAAIAKGNIAIGNHDYTTALDNFRDALKLKPLETYPVKQINYLEVVMKSDALAAEDKGVKEAKAVGEEQRIKNFNDGMAAYKRGEAALNQRKWEEALNEYTDFLTLIPDTKELNNYQYNAQGAIDFAKRKIVDLKSYLTRLKGSTYQAEALPYSAAELKSKYPNVNFNILTPDQLTNLPDSIKEMARLSKEVMTETPRLTYSDSANNVKITCLGITKKDNHVYLKLRILNSGTTDFLTGSMQLNVTKKDKKTTSLTPLYVTSSPVVLPGKEFNTIFVTRNYTVADTDTLSFEAADQLKKTKLKINIPAPTFNQEKSR